MRLLDTKTLELHDLNEKKPQAYAILSHRWEEGEISCKDVKKRRNINAPGWIKVRNFCALAAEDGLEYAWIDTCCIDKTSSAELTESINSMYCWYEDSTKCYVYLSDVAPFKGPVTIEHLNHSQWFKRGWTLQELLAPSNIVFIASDWKTAIGDKKSLDKVLSEITGIDNISDIDINRESIATKMSWAAQRKCTRKEDTAYSLLGIFGVNMPLLYGEGWNAFVRLQLEVLKISDDESIFAWGKDPIVFGENGVELVIWESGILARHPVCFAEARFIRSTGHDVDRPPYSMTNKGLEMQPVLISHPRQRDWYILPLNCSLTNSKETDEGPLCLLVSRNSTVGLGGRQFKRVGTTVVPLNKLVSQQYLGFFPSSDDAMERQLIYIR